MQVLPRTITNKPPLMSLSLNRCCPPLMPALIMPGEIFFTSGKSQANLYNGRAASMSVVCRPPLFPLPPVFFGINFSPFSDFLVSPVSKHDTVDLSRLFFWQILLYKYSVFFLHNLSALQTSNFCFHRTCAQGETFFAKLCLRIDRALMLAFVRMYMITL